MIASRSPRSSAARSRHSSAIAHSSPNVAVISARSLSATRRVGWAFVVHAVPDSRELTQPRLRRCLRADPLCESGGREIARKIVGGFHRRTELGAATELACREATGRHRVAPEIVALLGPARHEARARWPSPPACRRDRTQPTPPRWPRECCRATAARIRATTPLPPRSRRSRRGTTPIRPAIPNRPDPSHSLLPLLTIAPTRSPCT